VAALTAIWASERLTYRFGKTRQGRRTFIFSFPLSQEKGGKKNWGTEIKNRAR
jgi:hypothetical protein